MPPRLSVRALRRRGRDAACCGACFSPLPVNLILWATSGRIPLPPCPRAADAVQTLSGRADHSRATLCDSQITAPQIRTKNAAAKETAVVKSYASRPAADGPSPCRDRQAHSDETGAFACRRASSGHSPTHRSPGNTPASERHAGDRRPLRTPQRMRNQPLPTRRRQGLFRRTYLPRLPPRPRRSSLTHPLPRHLPRPQARRPPPPDRRGVRSRCRACCRISPMSFGRTITTALSGSRYRSTRQAA